jgi:hypothetical protein
MPPQGELARADLVPGCPGRRSAQRALAPLGDALIILLAIRQREAHTPNRPRRHYKATGFNLILSIGAIGGTLRPGVGQKEVTCGVIR